MKKFEKILVCLDLTEMDHFLINYSNFIVNIFRPGSLVFIHVMDSYDIPDEIMETFHDQERDLEDIVAEELEEKIEQGLMVKDKVDYSLVVEEGMTAEKIVGYAKKNKTDLCILGKKIGYRGQGSVARKIVGLIPSNVLVVSETSQHKIDKILVRMDFSRMSYSTLMMAKTISGYTGASAECHHVYKLPLNYYPKQSPESIKIMKEKVGVIVEKEYEKFIKRMNIADAPDCSYSLQIQTEESQLLYNYAINKGVDIILTGTRMKSPLAGLILDNTSEKLVGGEKNLPVMVVKDQTKSKNILDAIFD